MLRRSSVAALALCWSFLPVAPAQPASEPYRVDLTLAANCPAAGTFGRQLETRTRRLRRALPEERALVFALEIAPSSPGVVGRLTLREPDGTMTVRVLPGNTCAEVVNALALVAAILVDAKASTAPLQIQISEVVPAAGPPDQRPLRQSRGRSPRPWGFDVHLGAGLEEGALPSVAWGPMLELAVLPPLEPLPGAAILLSVRKTGSGPLRRVGGVASFSWTAARLGLCPWRWPERTIVAIRPCASLELGLLAVDAEETTNPTDQQLTWVAPGLLLVWELRLPRAILLGADLGANAVANRAKFFFGPQETVHTVPLFGFSADVFAGLWFP